jgi:hypothetical protein
MFLYWHFFFCIKWPYRKTYVGWHTVMMKKFTYLTKDSWHFLSYVLPKTFPKLERRIHDCVGEELIHNGQYQKGDQRGSDHQLWNLSVHEGCFTFPFGAFMFYFGVIIEGPGVVTSYSFFHKLRCSTFFPKSLNKSLFWSGFAWHRHFSVSWLHCSHFQCKNMRTFRHL